MGVKNDSFYTAKYKRTLTLSYSSGILKWWNFSIFIFIRTNCKKNKKNGCQKTEFKVASKFKMATKKNSRSCNFIDFGLVKNKKNIWKLQNQKWPLNSRWPPKFDLIIKSTNRLFNQTFCLLKRLSKYLIFIKYFFSQEFKMVPTRPYSKWRFFWYLFLAFVRNFKMQKFLHIL
jgi:hypothetical protein